MEIDEKLKSLSERIRILRLTKNLRQRDVAEQLGVSQASLSNIEAGRCAITLKNLCKLQDVLDCKMADFFVEIDKVEDEQQSEPKLENLRDLLVLAKEMKII